MVRLQRIERCDDPAFALTIGDRVTVIAGLAPERRDELCAAIAAGFAGQPVALGLQCCDNEGEFWLSGDALRQRSWSTTSSPIFEAVDLPGVLCYSFHENEPNNAEIYREQLQHACDAATARFAAIRDESSLQEQRKKLEDSAKLFAEQLGFVMLRRIEQLRQHRDEEVASGDDAETQETNLEAELSRYDELIAAISQRIDELRERLDGSGAEADEIEALLDEARRDADGPQRREEVKRIDQFGSRYQALAEENNRLCARPAVPKWIIAQTLGEYEEAKGRRDALQYQAKLGVNVRKALVRAEERFIAAEQAWHEVDRGVDEELRVVQEASAKLCRDVSKYLGQELVIAEVGQVLAKRREELCALYDPRIALCQVFASRKIVATYDNVCDVAEAWLQAQDRHEISFEEAQDALAAAVVDLQEQQHAKESVLARIAHAQQHELGEDVLRAAFGPQVMRDAKYQDAERSLQIVELAMLQKEIGVDGSCFVDDSEREAFDAAQRVRADELASAEDHLNVIARRITLFEHERQIAQHALHHAWWRGQDARDEVGDSQFGVATDVAQCDFAANRDALLRRFAGLRIQGTRETFPLIVNAAFDGLERSDAERLLGVIAKVSNLVQVIYFADTDLVLNWAAMMPSDVVGLVVCESDVLAPSE